VSLHIVGHLSPFVLIIILWSFLPCHLLVSHQNYMIQQVVSSASSFTGCWEFLRESSLPLAGFDLCHPRHSIYLIFSSLGVMPRVPTALHLPVTHDIIKKLANCKETINFMYIHVVCCRNLQLTVRWLLRVILRLWESHKLDTQVLLEFWGELLSWLTSWTSH